MKSFKEIVLVGVGAAAFLAAESVSAGDARVWVKFKPGSAEKTKSALLSVGAQIHYRFDDLGAFAVSVPEAALTGLQKNPNIEFIEEDVKRYPSAQTVPYGINKVQAPLVWSDTSPQSTGAGIKLCVIDSGVDPAHEDLISSNISGSDNDSLPWNVDGCGHGTHVTGTIAAQNNALGVVGVAPSVGIHMVRVFGNDCGWSYSSTLVDAAQKCQTAGAKVINMSLGGGLKSRVEQSAFGSLSSAGILSVAAAGNDGSTKLSYPASYPSVISVAAVDQINTVADFSQKNSAVELAAPGVGVLSTVPWLSVNTVTAGGTTYSGGSIENAAAATVTDEPLIDGGLCDSVDLLWTGQIVLCERGGISFYDKVTNVENGGGLAAVIYNNISGGFAATLGDGNSSTIPAIALSQEDGTALLEYLQASTTATAATVVSSFTPGDSGYEAWDGTSMATPHVSGVAALVWSANPSLTNVDIRNALTSTALDLGSAGKDNSYGYGLVQAKAALDALEGAGSGGGSGGSGSCDEVLPSISNVSFDATVKGPKFRITWNTAAPATSVVNLTGYGTYTDSSLVTNHSMTFTGSYGVEYEYSVSSTNCAGTDISGTTTGTNN